jgi:hypothetical protein
MKARLDWKSFEGVSIASLVVGSAVSGAILQFTNFGLLVGLSVLAVVTISAFVVGMRVLARAERER